MLCKLNSGEVSFKFKVDCELYMEIMGNTGQPGRGPFLRKSCDDRSVITGGGQFFCIFSSAFYVFYYLDHDYVSIYEVTYFTHEK